MPSRSDSEYCTILTTSMGSLNEIGKYWQVPNNSPSNKPDYMHEAEAVSRMIRNEMTSSGLSSKLEEAENERDSGSEENDEECDMDVDMLILNVREKLKMGSRLGAFNSSDLWTQTKYLDDEEERTENEGLKAHKSSSNSNGCDGGSLSKYNRSGLGSQSRLRNSNSCTSLGNYCSNQPSSAQGAFKQIINGGISKNHRAPLWSSKLSQFSKKKFPQGYNLLQELLDSGSLIKEAVRRINTNGNLFTPMTNNATESIKTTETCLTSGFHSEADFGDIHHPQIGSPVTRNMVY